MNVKDLKQDKRNYRKHDEKNKSLIKKSVNEVGLGRSIVIDADNEIVCGNGLVSTLDKNTPVKVIETDGTELVVVKRTDLKTDDEKRKRLAVMDNSTSDSSEFNLELLQTDFETEELKLMGIEIDGENEESEVVEDEAPEVDEESEPICKLGDIWQLGKHRLMCGDSTDKETVARLMDGKKADMVFTDPPYGYEYQSNRRKKTSKFDVLKNDDKILDFIQATKDEINGFVFICTTWKFLDKWLQLFKKYYDLTNMIIWDKDGGGIGDLEHTFSTDYEIILCSNNKKKITGKRIGSVWNVPKDNASDYVHATQKPIKLSAMAIENTTNRSEIVLDVFGGSGSTLIACEQLNRVCYMMELDPKYCDVIVKRWETLTGKKAEKIN